MPHHTVTTRQRTNARKMRKQMTEAELKLWHELRAHRLMGLGFRRQVPIGSYIVDFACPEHRLVVEVDGSGHADESQSGYDQVRTRFLEEKGWSVVRLWNDDVLKDVDGTCRHIVAHLHERGAVL